MGEAISIKNDILAVYSRCYSEIVPFQRAGCVDYVLLCQGAGSLRVVVRAQHANEETARICQCELCGVDEAAGRRALQFLYENAVSVENVCDVLQDIFSAAGAAGKAGNTGTDALP